MSEQDLLVREQFCSGNEQDYSKLAVEEFNPEKIGIEAILVPI